MELDDAIKHCHETAEEKRKDYEQACAYNLPSEGCLECAKEHEQLAVWLEELKEWHIRKEMSKNGKCSVIVQGEPLYITQGHLEALIKYDEEQTAKEALDRMFKNINEFRRKDDDSI